MCVKIPDEALDEASGKALNEKSKEDTEKTGEAPATASTTHGF